jgi:hypothetical protein
VKDDSKFKDGDAEDLCNGRVVEDAVRGCLCERGLQSIRLFLVRSRHGVGVLMRGGMHVYNRDEFSCAVQEGDKKLIYRS